MSVYRITTYNIYANKNNEPPHESPPNLGCHWSYPTSAFGQAAWALVGYDQWHPKSVLTACRLILCYELWWRSARSLFFLVVLAAHPKAPLFCAVDNFDHGLNPGLAKALMKNFAEWVLSSPHERQILMNSHNPAVLDGLPLQDDRVRLFTVDRDNHGKTIVKPVVVDKRLLEMAAQGWTLSRLWMNKLIEGMPDV